MSFYALIQQRDHEVSKLQKKHRREQVAKLRGIIWGQRQTQVNEYESERN